MGFAGGVDSVAGDVVADRSSDSGYSRVNEGGGRESISRADVDRESAVRSAANQDAIDRANSARLAAEVGKRQMAEAEQARLDAAARDAAARDAAAREFQKRQMAEAEQARIDSIARQEATKNLGVPSLMTGTGVMSPPTSSIVPEVNPLTASAGRYGTMGYRAPAITGVSDEDRERMIRTVLGEAGGEPLIGQTGVASVIANRLRAGNYGSTIGDVVNAPKQFSTWNPGDPAGDMANRVDPNSQSYKNAADIVDSVLRGEARDPTGGALNFSNVNTVMTSGQASEATKARVAAESSLPTATPIGQHTFTSPVGSIPTQVATLGGTIRKTLEDGFNSITPAGVASTAIQAGAYVASPVLGLANTVSGYFGGPTLQDTFLGGPTAQQEFNRDRQMSSEEANIAQFNRLHPEAGSDRERYGGADRSGIASLGKKPKDQEPVATTAPTVPAVPTYTTGIDFSPRYYTGPQTSTETYSPNPEYYTGYNRLG